MPYFKIGEKSFSLKVYSQPRQIDDLEECLLVSLKRFIISLEGCSVRGAEIDRPAARVGAEAPSDQPAPLINPISRARVELSGTVNPLALLRSERNGTVNLPATVRGKPTGRMKKGKSTCYVSAFSWSTGSS